ncbi:uncharacterized protein nompA isoform X2 [Cherax quadricarinatus]|uniref:uncharacterized protein nompA isoform X2 n=1 Tax=Cherax quadricarinatus TaxID=27406 RepID=UPI0023789B79|nr:uncharacterized protein LOC128700346 isoform X2 [Cherax quadricarinatus]
MPCRIRATSMFNAVAIVSALHLLSEGMLPAAEGTGEPYGINRQVVEGAARAGAAMNGQPSLPRQLDSIPAPALNQVVTGDDPLPGEVADETLTAEINITVDDPGQQSPAEEGGEREKPKTEGKEASLPACNNGVGLVRYERLPDTVMERTPMQADVIRKNDTPVEVLGMCVDRCLQDETAQGFKSVCTAFDFHPGRKINYYNNALGFTETKCLLTRPPDQYSEIRYRDEQDSVHFREVCYTASVVRAECPTRMYAMERLRNKRFIPKDAVQVVASTIEECQDKCLNQYADEQVSTNRTCRSGTFDKERRRCYHSSYTVRTHPNLLEHHQDYDYFENTCLTKDRRCPKNKLMFVKAVNTELAGSYDTEVHRGVELDECKERCIDGVSIFCRSLEYDTTSKTCVLSDEDAISKPDQIRTSTSDRHQYYQVLCIDGGQFAPQKVKGDYLFENSDTQQLNQRRYSDVRTAFQLFRDSRLELGSGFRGFRELAGRLTLAECLDECLEERSFPCRSAMHSEYSQVCRLSEYDQLNGRLVPDREYNYFENLMENLMVTRTASGSSDTGVVVAGGRTSVSAEDQPTDGVDEAGPGSAGQTGASRPGVGTRFPGDRTDSDAGSGASDIGGTGGRVSFSAAEGSRGAGGTNRFGDSSESRFGDGNKFGDSRFGVNRGSTDSSFVTLGGRGNGDGESRFRPLSPSRPVGTPQQDQPGIFRPVSTDLTREFAGGRGALNRVFGSGRQTDAGSRILGALGAVGVGVAGADDPLSTMEVTQQCTEDGMEFNLRTEEPFRGRIYTYGYYDRCFTRGSGSTVTVLKISGARGIPECGTIKYADTTTNIVVVQFSDNVQTSLDKRYNLTCTVVGPGEAVVTSGYIGAGSGAPTPIEYLPAENQLQSKVRLQIMYGGRPTTTIAVGDPLTFKLESQRGFNLVSDIFATNVVAKDPYSGRSVELIDSRGCPVDNYVFPALGKGRDGDGLEARFNAFKIPEANFLIFEANVRTCRRGCEPARCTLGKGRDDAVSYGRRRRGAGDDLETQTILPKDNDDDDENSEDEGQVHGIYEVYLSREEIDEQALTQTPLQEVCLGSSEYYSLIVALVITVACLVASLLCVAFCFRKHRQLDLKNAAADAGNPYHQQQLQQQQPQQQHLQQKSKFSFPGSHPRTLTQPASYFPSGEPTSSAPQAEDGAATSSRFPDPSEPIYTDPALFERSSSDQPTRQRYADGEE